MLMWDLIHGLVKKDDGTIYNLGTDGINDFNGKIMKEIPSQMLKGEFPLSCIRCKREHEAGMDSRASGNVVFGKIQQKK